jgi:hypothetical protein
MDLREVGCEVVDWAQVAEDRGQWRLLGNMEIKFEFNKRRGIW